MNTEISAVFGGNVSFLGFLADGEVSRRIVAADALIAFFPHGARENNTTVLSAMAQGGAPGAEVSTLKVRGSEIQQRIAELAMEAVGEYAQPYQPGMLFHDTNETPVGPDHAPPAAPRYFNMRKTSIYGGSTEIQKNIVSKMVLGL